jgi:hypothetical protein
MVLAPQQAELPFDRMAQECSEVAVTAVALIVPPIPAVSTGVNLVVREPSPI